MKIVLSGLAALFVAAASSASDTSAGMIDEVVPAELLAEALASRDAHAARVGDVDRMTIIDYRRRSSERRFYLIDFDAGTAEALLVAHGRGSDPDHDGVADTFSNTPGSKMTSLGAFVTGDTYYGAHGLSLKLHGLEPRNDKAEARAIVIHGAVYVTPARAVLGRSWGCPALEMAVVERVIDAIKGGTFLYVVG